MRRARVHVTGASGSGTTTLARRLADVWAAPHADTDDYFWLPTDPPFVQSRPPGERVALMRQVFLPRAAWVLSGSILDWGDEVIDCFDAVVFLALDPAERIRRLEARELARQERGQVDAEAHAAFMAWARGYDDAAFEGRSRVAHEKWLAALPCPVLRLDSALTTDQLCDEVLAWDPPDRGV